MPGPIRITLERAPDFFAAASLGWDRHFTAIAREPETGELFAMCSRSVRKFFVNGNSIPLGYLSQLRVLPGHRAHKLRLLKTGFEWLASTHESMEAGYDFSTLVKGNSPATRLLTAGLKGLPRYTEMETMQTFLLPIRRRSLHPSGVSVRRLNFCDERVIECLQRFGKRHQFAPHWAREDFWSPPTDRNGRTLPIGDAFAAVCGNEVVGCVGLWDQRAQKQVVVRGYNHALAWSRPILNLFGANLPRCGSVLPLAWLSPFAINNDSSAVFEALVGAASEALRGRSDVQWLALMLAKRDPMALPARRLAARHYASRLFVVHSPETRVSLDGSIPYLEGALL